MNINHEIPQHHHTHTPHPPTTAPSSTPSTIPFSRFHHPPLFFNQTIRSSVFDNIRKFLQFQLTVNVVALIITFLSAVSVRAVCTYIVVCVC